MPEDRWMPGKAAVSPRSAAVQGGARTRPVCPCGVPAGTRSSAERFRGVRTSGTGQTQRDVVSGTLAPQLGSGTAGRLGYCGIASSGRLLDRESAVRCPESQREREGAATRPDLAAGVNVEEPDGLEKLA